MARQLAGDPRLADNPQFLATHPGLDSYLSQHPEVRQELQQHPDRFISDQWRDDLCGRGHPLANTDHYLDDHPEVTQQLEKNPALVDNEQFFIAIRVCTSSSRPIRLPAQIGNRIRTTT